SAAILYICVLSCGNGIVAWSEDLHHGVDESSGWAAANERWRLARSTTGGRGPRSRLAGFSVGQDAGDPPYRRSGRRDFRRQAAVAGGFRAGCADPGGSRYALVGA